MTRRESFVVMTQQEYIELLLKEKDTSRRQRMKLWAYSAMYGNNPEAKVMLANDLVRDEDFK